MMATPSKPQCFLNQRLSFRLQSLVMIMIWLFSVTESVDPMTVTGEVGGNVTIICPIQGPFEFFYFQRDRPTEYVNGYHSTKNLTNLQKTQPWPNTRLGDHKRTVHMNNLTISHSGYYVCYVKYTGKDVIQTHVHLNVTAKYTKPKVKINCYNGLSCMVTCSSYGGYPKKSMSWSVPGSPVWKEVNTNVTDDPKTMMMNSFSTAYFNCSNGQLEHITCSVGEVTSDIFSVCTPSPVTGNNAIRIAIFALVAVSIISALLVLWRCKGRGTGAVPVEVRQELGQTEEEVELNNRAS